jgi:hypothetical protein
MPFSLHRPLCFNTQHPTGKSAYILKRGVGATRLKYASCEYEKKPEYEFEYEQDAFDITTENAYPAGLRPSSLSIGIVTCTVLSVHGNVDTFIFQFGCSLHVNDFLLL